MQNAVGYKLLVQLNVLLISGVEYDDASLTDSGVSIKADIVNRSLFCVVYIKELYSFSSIFKLVALNVFLLPVYFNVLQVFV